MALTAVAIAVILVALIVGRRHFLLWVTGYPKLFLLAGFVVALLVAWILFKRSDFLAVDRCLDQGGRWNYETKECERAP